MQYRGLASLAAALALTVALQVAADDRDQRAVASERQLAELHNALETLQRDAERHGVEISDIRIQLNPAGSDAHRQPDLGCKVSRHQFFEEMQSEVRLEARAPTCREALQLLDEV